MNNPKIYRCSICKNIVLKLADHSEMLTCCNQPMVLLPCNSDGAGEKHIPIITTKTKKTLTVQISSTIHPMTPEHHIEWIGVFSPNTWTINWLTPQDKPITTFTVSQADIIYCYCNIHGLWKNISN